MKKLLETTVSILFLCSFLASCTTGDLGISFDVKPDSEVNTVVIDTFSVNTFMYSPVELTNQGGYEILSGKKVYDEDFSFEACSYFTIAQPTYTYKSLSGGTDLKIDSVRFVLPVVYAEGDSTVSQSYSLIQLDQEIDLNEIYYTTSFIQGSELIDQQSITPYWNRDSVLTFEVSSDLYQPAFDLYKENPDNIALVLDELIKGFKLVSDESNTAMLHINASGAAMRIYGHYDDVFADEFELDFPVETGYRLFNTFSVYQNGELIELSKDALMATDQKFILQDGLPVVTKLTLPGIDNFNELYPGKTVLKAELIFHTFKKSISDGLAVPSTLSLYTINLLNEPQEAIIDFNTSAVVAEYESDFSEEMYRGSYSFDVTAYVLSLLEYKASNKGLDMLTENSLTNGGSTSAVVLGDQSSGDYACSLRVYVTN
ncbi:DUF4270 family protein [Jiulongibacter sp. NS-SX5]|uniref:DUF4270 family protein n=1 Tax=Jiulongibacter sp. NS-SX5 TaxID=3463854 RepID=UPI004059032D